MLFVGAEEGKSANVYTAAQVMISLAAGVSLFGFVGYIMLCRNASCASQSMTFFPQFLAGIG